MLVHGGWHGGCWAAAISTLELMGNRALAMDLPGRSTHPLDHAKVTRARWVDTVVRFIEERDLHDVVLTGHSLGGLTISGVAVSIPRHVKRLIFVSALVPPTAPVFLKI